MIKASEKVPLTITVKNVTVSFREGAESDTLFDCNDENTRVIGIDEIRYV